MERAEWGDARITKCVLHGTFRRYAGAITRTGLRAGGGWKDRAFIFLVPMLPGARDHPGLRSGTDAVVKIDAERFMKPAESHGGRRMIVCRQEA